MIGLIERLTARVRNMVGLATVTGINDAGAVQQAALSQFPVRTIAGAQVAMPFGLSSVAPAGSNAVFVSMGGLGTETVVIGFANAGRPAGKQPGETVLYNAAGILIDLGAAGLTISAAGLPVAISNASAVTIASSGGVTINATGTVAVTGTSFTFNGLEVMTA